MNDFTTDRFALPLLAAGQAGKEITHNEALVTIDLALGASVIGLGVDAPPADPRPGDCWIVGPAPTGAWLGRAGAIAGWTTAGWRFVEPREGMAVWNSFASRTITYHGDMWHDGDVSGARLMIEGLPVVGSRGAAIADPAGGAIADAEARGAIAGILAALRRHGLIAA
ncbi:DUF2793 domain-containing protein [Sphingomonas beigongshangi]|jgi:hypothetical protein|uniref:DUF2793 domain-containing protein n=1 Tax=Sphingomonas beigongshangi TaxID=2782540 RepID=UPI001AEED09B|nr:DUF2793 domain-containing protein [Sphingomonas beigongshangi]